MDKFFHQKNCDRCNAELKARIMSWFTTETICMECSVKEGEIKAGLPDGGRLLEGCGYVPKTESK